MYSFCITIPYSGIVALGGIIGYVKAGSLPSLLAGLGLGSGLAMLGYGELQEYKKTQAVTRKWTLLSLLVSGGMTIAMGLKCAKTKGSLAPAIFASTSGLVSVFLMYRVVVPVPPKKDKK
ncbi:Uncharacterized protein family UPF0136, Transmembrane [Nannochloropsis gaditana]|uniref:Uncharacterized protein family UPF0136, Transmembrane n=1 Tax=Nannochloropsis gaditana TaxID=72520 RepID=W7TZW6_9STRA|nr:Uncharacterized protein family UPF0136, Transmembrane [Nannochloropsis gaditana]